MDLLFSNYPPMRTRMESFADKFYSLIPMSKKLDIAVQRRIPIRLQFFQRLKTLVSLEASHE